MRYLARILEKSLSAARRHFPAIILTWPRRAGKTTLLTLSGLLFMLPANATDRPSDGLSKTQKSCERAPNKEDPHQNKAREHS